MTSRETAMQLLSSLPNEASWEEVLRTIRGAAADAGPNIRDEGEEVREVGPAWVVERTAERTTGEEAAMRSYDVVVERDEEGWFVGSVPGLPGCHTQARTLEQLLERVREVIALCLEASGGAGSAFIGIRRVTVPA
jgi:predicted RNase H-like HicB family nuclease